MVSSHYAYSSTIIIVPLCLLHIFRSKMPTSQIAYYIIITHLSYPLAQMQKDSTREKKCARSTDTKELPSPKRPRACKRLLPPVSDQLNSPAVSVCCHLLLLSASVMCTIIVWFIHCVDLYETAKADGLPGTLQYHYADERTRRRS